MADCIKCKGDGDGPCGTFCPRCSGNGEEPDVEKLVEELRQELRINRIQGEQRNAALDRQVELELAIAAAIKYLGKPSLAGPNEALKVLKKTRTPTSPPRKERS